MRSSRIGFALLSFPDSAWGKRVSRFIAKDYFNLTDHGEGCKVVITGTDNFVVTIFNRSCGFSEDR